MLINDNDADIQVAMRSDDGTAQAFREAGETSIQRKGIPLAHLGIALKVDSVASL
jgi:hypothetical protein